MEEKEGKTHVPVMELWSYGSGTANLTENNFEHLLLCFECQSLLDEFTEILDKLPSYRQQAAA
jgi:hypothetical protein